MNTDLPILADAPASAIIPATAGAAASAAAAATIFRRYQQRLAPATRDRQRSDLARCAEYPAAVQVIAPSETITVAEVRSLLGNRRGRRGSKLWALHCSKRTAVPCM
jgi:hypothetical protein